MSFESLIAFNLALLAALAVPGPALLFAIRTSLVRGRTAGILCGLGLGTMASLWTALALLGLNRLFALMPFAYVALKTLGALYLLWIAYATWRDAHQPLPRARAAKARAFGDGVLVNFANPKSVLFAAAVLVVVFPRDLALADKAVIVANHFVVEALVYGAFAVALSTKPVADGYLRAKPLLDRIAGSILGLLGLNLLLDRGR